MSRYRTLYLNLRKRPLHFWGRLLLGAIFLAASLDKIRHPHAFAEIIYNYQILPDLPVTLTAIILPWAELVLGLVLIIGLWIPGAILLSSSGSYDPAAELPANTATNLIFYCGNDDCRASDGAAKRARDAGYSNVHLMRAGIAGWKAAGKRTEAASSSS